MAQEQDIKKAALIITVADFSVALLAGLVIFPVVFSNGLSPSAGSELAFTTLPIAFSVIPAGRLFSVAFFTVLFFAAITSSVSMLEVCVAAVDEATGWTRKKTTVILTALLLPATLLPALSYSALHLTLGGVPLLDVMDETVGTLGLHIAAILLAVAFTWFLPEDVFLSGLGAPTRLNRFIFRLCRYLIPAMLILTVASELFAGTQLTSFTFVHSSRHISSLIQAEAVALFAFLVLLACTVTGWMRR